MSETISVHNRFSIGIGASDKDLPVTGNTRETHSDIKLMPYDGKWGYILNQLSDQRLAFLKSFGR